MFIPNNKNAQIKTLARDVVTLNGTFKKGSKVRITGHGERGYDFVDIESGEEAIEVSDIWGGVPIFED